MNANDLKCIFCKQIPISIYECTGCGAPACMRCQSIKKSCNECSTSLFIPSMFGELLINNLPYPCPDCREMILKSQLERHKKICGELKLKCKLDCKDIIKRNDFPFHLMEKHEAAVLSYIENPSVNAPYSSNTSGVSSDKFELHSYPNEFNGVWPNGSKLFMHKDSGYFTFSCYSSHYNSFVSFKIYIKKTESPGHIVLGLSNKIFNDTKGYLGGDLGTGNWGIAGNGSLGEEGKWSRGLSYKEGDIVEILYNYGTISYSINGAPNSYTYKTVWSAVYLSATVYYKGVELVII